MCGITGILSLDKKIQDPLRLKKMCDVMRHRGPDDAGYAFFGDKGFLDFSDAEFGCKNPGKEPVESREAKRKITGLAPHLSLGHRRLSIIDLSSKGHQPMSDGKSWIVFNGEIYNFQEIKKELIGRGHSFISSSDTEVILKSYAEWGIDCVRRFNGMFAFSLWDLKKKKLYLARDRFGVIPVYYYFSGGTFIFGSEIKAILESGQVRAGIDYQALNEYFTFQNIFSDLTLFEDIKILKPGHYIEIAAAEKKLSVNRYWDYDFSNAAPALSFDRAKEKLFDLFQRAVKRQLVSDVPVGSYLSGGMDSGSIAAISKERFRRLWTFTVGFDLSSASGLELGFDERAYSEQLANILKTEHYESVLHAGDMEAVLPDLVWHIEDLRVGQSYPDYYASRLAGKFVKVVLSGAGGDELFGGYPWRYYRGLNPRDKEDYYKKYYDYWQRLISDGEKSLFFNADTYLKIKSHSTFDVFRSVFRKDTKPVTNGDYINESLYFEAKTFLHGLFVVTNKISMAHSLETRVPFLDNDLVEFSCKIPPAYKLKNLGKVKRMDENDPAKLKKYYARTNDGKIILREAMRELLPRNILEREKQGFSAPDASWFRGESINYLKSRLLAKDANIYRFLNRDFVEKKLREHISARKNNRLFIWSLISFEWWIEKFLK